MADKDEAKEAQ
jgi:Thioredoxin-like